MLIDSSVLQVAGEIGKVNGISRVLFANSDGYKGFMPGKVYIACETKILLFQTVEFHALFSNYVALFIYPPF